MTCRPLFLVVDCGDPVRPDYSESDPYITTYNQVVVWRCIAGYKMNGTLLDYTITCMENAYWDKTTPNCISKSNPS